MKKFNLTPKASPFILLVLFVFFASSATAQWNMWGKGVKGNGNVTTETRNVSDFNKVSVSAGITVIYSQGSKNVEVEADSNLQEYIITEVKGEKLVVRRKKNTNIKKYKKMTVYVSSPNIYYASASSGSKFKSEGQISTENLKLDSSSGASMKVSATSKKIELDSSSGSNIVASLEAEKISADASSGSSIKMNGSANQSRLGASSGASVNARDLTTKSCDANVSSAGSVDITVTESIDGSASSGGSVDYWGNPSEVNRSTSSGGSVSRK